MTRKGDVSFLQDGQEARVQRAPNGWKAVGEGSAGKERPHLLGAVCLPGHHGAQACDWLLSMPMPPPAVVMHPRSIIHQLQPEKAGVHRKPSSLHTAQSPALLKGWKEGFLCHIHIVDIVYLSYIWCMHTCINTNPSFPVMYFYYLLCIAHLKKKKLPVW